MVANSSETPEKQLPSTPGSNRKSNNRPSQRGGGSDSGGRDGGGRGRGGRGGRGSRGGRGGRGGRRGGGRGTPNNRTKRGRGRGRGGRGEYSEREKIWKDREEDKDGLRSDEGVMIEFMHLMRGGDEEAKQVFAEFGNTQGKSQQNAFVKQVRKFLKEKTLAQIQRKDLPGNEEMNKNNHHQNDKKEFSTSNAVDKDNNADVVKNLSNIIQKEVGMKEKSGQPQSSAAGPIRHNIEGKDDVIGNSKYIVDESVKVERRNSFDHIMAKLSVKPNSSSNVNVSHGSSTKTTMTQGAATLPQTPTTRSLPHKPKATAMGPPPGLGHLSPTPPANIHSNAVCALPSPGPPTTSEEAPKAEKAKVNTDDDTKETTPVKEKPKWQPKRFLTRVQEQPGKLIVNNEHPTLNGYPHIILPIKKEFVATWSLPLQYLQQRTLHKLQLKKEKALSDTAAAANEEVGKDKIKEVKAPESLTIRDALQSLTVGLFRRGCPENGTNHSIISKQVVPSKNTNDDNNNNQSRSSENEYHFEINNQTGVIYGTVPFYSPRTPGNVVLRLYFEDDAPVTLATSKCIKVTVNHDDLEQTLRFILTNFKTRKGSTSGSLSCIHSLASVLDQLPPLPSRHQNHQQNYHNQRYRNTAMDGAGRAAWGCICESRKIVDLCRFEYQKKKDKLDKQLEDLEKNNCENVEDTDKENPESTKSSSSPEGKNSDIEMDQKIKEWKEKKNSLMGDRSSNERRWREVQGTFANVLKAIINNEAASAILKHDIVMKLRLEYALWCSFCESFAPNPYEVVQRREKEHDRESHNERSSSINYPHPITNAHINRCKQSCAKMQKECLGFVPKKNTFASIEHNQQQGPTGVSLCANLSKAMEKMFNEEYVPSMESIQKKSKARDLTQNAVSICDAFPEGTRVVIFGSSANGFGSPTSDLDMCLQLPPSSLIKNFEGEGGSTAMASLAEKLEELGMVDVDKARLTARIPVIKFYCKIHSEEEHQNDERGSDTMIECDISMQNPLAVINTALLRNYSALKPEVRILVAIIKRWAKSRDINNPSNHTLSSYGYIIMLLHFLTTHKANNANIEPFYQKKQQMSRQQQSPQLSGCPLLPNLQWMNPHWIQSQLGTPYQELEMQPKNQYTMMHHPSENTFLVNKYFCQLNDEALMMNLHRHLEYHDHHHGKESQCKPLVGRILASFFYYYAYEFDYKKHVVSLQSHSNGVIEREAKSENDGWKSFGQSLCIEDPFETFYDVAHVLKPMSFQRVKREFALAYTKIVESFTNDGNKTGNFGYNLLDKICEDTDTESL